MMPFTHMSSKFIRMLETIFSSSKIMPAYLQGTVWWSCHTPLTGLLGADPSMISHPRDILGRRIHDFIPSQLPHFLNPNTIASWLINGNVFHKGVGYNPRLLSSMRKSLIECIHKGGGHTIYKLIILTYSYLFYFQQNR